MKFFIQDPSYEKSKYLHETLLTECKNGCIGAGVYAFATKDGIELLLEDENFKKFMQTGKFFLIVGMDDITNVNAIETLRKFKEKYKNHLEVKAYIHNSSGSTFHPKYSWFKKNNGGVLILGSGNLTHQGLRHNREAYSVIDFDDVGISDLISEWNEWILHSNPFLFDVSNDIVIEKAQQNSDKLRATVEAQKVVKSRAHIATYAALAEIYKSQPQNREYELTNKKNQDISMKESADIKQDPHIDNGDEELDVDMSYWVLKADDEMLFAEIPKNGDRMSQVNFDKQSFEEYFGAKCGQNGDYRILFREVNKDGSLSNVEVRPSVSVESHNYRFELEAAKGVNYPKDGRRPVGVFAKISQRDFMYEIVMPDDRVYQQVIEIMDTKKQYSNNMRRLRFLCSEVYENTQGLQIMKRLDINE